jgi:hypothetical protein
VGTGKHLLALNIVTAETLFGHLGGLGFARELDQLAVVRDILGVAVGAAHRPLVPFLVTAHALPVLNTLEPDSSGQLWIEGILVTGGTPGGFQGFGLGRPMVMADGAIFEDTCVFFVHKSNRPVEVFFSLDDRVIQEEVVERYVFELGGFIPKAGLELGRIVLEHLLDESNNLDRPTLGRMLASLPGTG